MGDVILAGSGRFWTIRYRAAWDHQPYFHGQGMAGAPSWSQGDVTKIESPSPSRYNQWEEIAAFQASPDRATLPLTTRFTVDRSELLTLTRLRCPFDVQVHMGQCEDPRDFDFGWTKILVFENASITSYAPTELGAMEGSEQAAVNEEVELSARDIYEIMRMNYIEVAQSYVSELIEAVSVCDEVNCGTCSADPSDGCQKVFALSDPKGSSPGVKPQLIVTKDGYATAFERWITSAVIGTEASDGTCVGSYYVMVSQDGLTLHYASLSDILDQIETWVANATGFVAAKGPNAIWSYSPLDTWIVGQGGYIYKLVSPASGVTVQNAGVATTENLLDVDGISATLVVAVGANNTVVVTRDGKTWGTITGPEVGASLQAIEVKNEKEWWIGTSTGKVWATRDQGSHWTQVTSVGVGLTLTAIDKIIFASDTVGFIAARIAGPLGRVFRTIDGGYTWYLVPDSPSASDVPANDYIKDIAVCKREVNVVYMGGLSDAAADGILIKGSY